MTPFRLLFVCTGNTCRSPMAEHLLRDRLPADTDWRGCSAGIAACRGALVDEAFAVTDGTHARVDLVLGDEHDLVRGGEPGVIVAAPELARIRRPPSGMIWSSRGRPGELA